MSWFDDKELLSGVDAICWNSLKKKKKSMGKEEELRNGEKGLEEW